jgi:hypothetical protein
MAIVHPRAILLANQNRPHHRFNEAVIGDGRDYDQAILADNRVEVVLNVGVPPDAAPPGPILLKRRDRIGCHINTDSAVSLFQGNVAFKLNLQPRPPFLGIVSTCVGNVSHYWNEYSVYVGLHPGYIPVSVWFPVELGNDGWQWEFGFPTWNVLGMRGVIDRRMLSINALEVYSMKWRAP